MINMNWVEQAKQIFLCEKPEHFTNYEHCCECFEHDETLRNSDVDSIGYGELGNAGWDPICFCTVEGKKYYMPALVRLSLSSIDEQFYLEQFLFHLEGDGMNNDLFQSCSSKQRQFIARFIEYCIINHANKLESNLCQDEALRVHEIWTNDKQ